MQSGRRHSMIEDAIIATQSSSPLLRLTNSRLDTLVPQVSLGLPIAGGSVRHYTCIGTKAYARWQTRG
jgi:hypothetical protein